MKKNINYLSICIFYNISSNGERERNIQFENKITETIKMNLEREKQEMIRKENEMNLPPSTIQNNEIENPLPPSIQNNENEMQIILPSLFENDETKQTKQIQSWSEFMNENTKKIQEKEEISKENEKKKRIREIDVKNKYIRFFQQLITTDPNQVKLLKLYEKEIQEIDLIMEKEQNIKRKRKWS